MSLGSVGSVVESERGSLPYALIHGEPLVACAAWALGASGATLLDLGTEWSDIVETGQPLVLHDVLCPMTPPAFLAHCAARATELDRIVVGVRPVTDTTKVVTDGYVGATLDRDRLVQVVSPVVLPASVVAAIDGLPDIDFARLVAALAVRFPVEQVDAPADARRVLDEADLLVLEAMTVGR